jgi:hypothetical protein
MKRSLECEKRAFRGVVCVLVWNQHRKAIAAPLTLLRLCEEGNQTSSGSSIEYEDTKQVAGFRSAQLDHSVQQSAAPHS